jgi:hypothetical protein
VTARHGSRSSKLKTPVWVSLIALSLASACSRGVDLRIQNNGRETLRNVEVDYPGAAFGIGTLAPGASYAYRMKPLSTGDLTVAFELQNGKDFKQKGPTVPAGKNTHMLLVLEQDDSHQWHMRAEQK